MIRAVIWTCDSRTRVPFYEQPTGRGRDAENKRYSPRHRCIERANCTYVDDHQTWLHVIDMGEYPLVLNCQSLLIEHPAHRPEKAVGSHRALLRNGRVNNRVVDKLFNPIVATAGDKMNRAASGSPLNIGTTIVSGGKPKARNTAPR
jgi:hypothetical protein